MAFYDCSILNSSSPRMRCSVSWGKTNRGPFRGLRAGPDRSFPLINRRFTGLGRRACTASLAMNPSWWVRNVNIVLLFGDAGGMWLQTALEATANVRVLGQATVISHDVSYEITEVVAGSS